MAGAKPQARIVRDVLVLGAAIAATALLTRYACGTATTPPAGEGAQPLVAGAGSGAGAQAISLGPLTPFEADGGVTRADFLGPEACAGCHAPVYAKWKASTHGRAGGKPGEVA